MECNGVIYDSTETPEQIRLVVPIATENSDFTSGDIIEPLAKLKMQINEVLSLKIGDSGNIPGIPDLL